MIITDFHTHAFPDAIVERAMKALLAETTDVTAFLDGRIASLLASMDRAGIGRAVLCSIATKPDQFEKILAWSKAIRSNRMVPFPSVHPRDPRAAERVGLVADAGFKGIKLHPYYQDFDLDDPLVFPLYEALQARGLILECHTGFDVAFARIRKCDPARIVKTIERFPDLKFVATHFGSWEDWDEVEARLLGRAVFIELSYSLHLLGPERARRMLLRHPREYVLFGTDSPWRDQPTVLGEFRALHMGDDWEQAVLSANAARLLE